MTFECDAAATAGRATALECARSVVAPVAADIDREASVPAAVRDAARAVLAPLGDGVAWALGIEALAGASAAVALVAVADVLHLAPATAPAQWGGLRGADVDGLKAHLDSTPAGDIAITAMLLGTASHAVDAAATALKAAKAAGAPPGAAHPALSDAATALDAARLLLWEAAQAGDGGATARALARLESLEVGPLAWQAVRAALGSDAFRPGAPLERVRRDATTLADVLGSHAAAEARAAAGVLPA